MESIKTERLKICATANGAENVFKEIEKKTGTKIQFSSGRFSNSFKRDPVIKVCGQPSAVKIAKEMVLQNLEVESNRIIMKMDIMHEEHPSLIGKKGSLIMKVMEYTNTRVHFPDTNKVKSNVKSNQVSIAGDPFNVERARIMLRALLPFQVRFHINNDLNIGNAAFIFKKIQVKLGLDISFENHDNTISVIIRCIQGMFPSLRQQILYLIEGLSGKRGSDLPPVSVIMDIMQQHHYFVRGPRNCNILAIAQRTGAEIIFPNKSSEESEDVQCVHITGSLDSVFMAWQEVMSSLPMSVSFDVSESRDTNNDFLDLLLDYNICVYCRPKPRYSIKNITVKGPERFSKQIVQYRQRILNLPPIKFDSDMDPIQKALTFQNSNPEVQNSHLLVNLLSVVLQNSSNAINVNSYFQDTENLAPFMTSPLAICNNTSYKKNTFEKHDGIISTDKSSARFNSHGYSSSYTGSSLYSLDFNDLGKIMPSEYNNNGVIENKKNSEQPNLADDDKYPVTDDLLSEMVEKRLSAHQAIHREIESTQVPSSIWAGYGFSQSMPAVFINKMKEPYNRYSCTSLNSNSKSSSEESFGFSNYTEDKIWPDRGENNFSKSNVFDFKTFNSTSLMQFNSDDILPKLLYQEGLYNYIDVFLREEIDYSTFLLLKEADLMNLGINYFARMKIVCLIRELQDAEMKTFDAAPGAGRKLK